MDFVEIIFTETKNGKRLVYNQIDTAHADMSFIKITKTQLVFKRVERDHSIHFKELFESIPEFIKMSNFFFFL